VGWARGGAWRIGCVWDKLGERRIGCAWAEGRGGSRILSGGGGGFFTKNVLWG